MKVLPGAADAQSPDFAMVKQTWDLSSDYERRNPRHAYIICQTVAAIRRAEKAEKEASKVSVLEQEKAALAEEVKTLKSKLTPPSTQSKGSRPTNGNQTDLSKLSDEEVKKRMKEEERMLANHF